MKEVYSQEEMDALNRHQENMYIHPYTCNGGNPDFSTHHDHTVILEVTPYGLKCPECGRTQVV